MFADGSGRDAGKRRVAPPWCVVPLHVMPLHRTTLLCCPDVAHKPIIAAWFIRPGVDPCRSVVVAWRLGKRLI